MIYNIVSYFSAIYKKKEKNGSFKSRTKFSIFKGDRDVQHCQVSIFCTKPSLMKTLYS